MKVELKAIKRIQTSTSNMLTGSSSTYVVEAQITFLENFDGMFYIGDWSGIPQSGKTVFVNIKADSENEAAYNMQNIVDIVNIEPIASCETHFQLVKKELNGETTILEGSIYSVKQDAVNEAKRLDRLTGGDFRVKEVKVFGPINFKCNE